MIYEYGCPSIFFTFNTSPDQSITVAMWNEQSNDMSNDINKIQTIIVYHHDIICRSLTKSKIPSTILNLRRDVI